MNRQRIIVIGAGAAGMLAAGRAAELSADHDVEVVLLERMRQVGRKIRISGKGRCNLTNTLSTPEFIKHFGRTGKFLRNCLAKFSSDDLIAFLNNEGLPTSVERGGRIFPSSGRAPDVAHTLQDWVVAKGVKLETGARVRGIDATDGRVTGVHFDRFAEDGSAGSGGSRGRHELSASVVIVATGGRSYAATGSSGDGYSFAEGLGHSIAKTRPSLVPLLAKGAPPEGIRRLALRNLEATLWIDGKLKAREFGELYFIDTGLSGPIVLEISRIAVAALDERQKVELSLDLKPALDLKKLDARLQRDLADRKFPLWLNVVEGLLPKDLIPTALAASGTAGDIPCHQITGSQRKALVKWLKDYRFKLSGYGGFKEAIVTAGGVKTAEVDPQTLESKRAAGLYIIGELLDVDADTGGFNMMAAFSTGWVAGEAAAKALLQSKDN